MFFCSPITLMHKAINKHMHIIDTYYYHISPSPPYRQVSIV